MKKRNQRVLWGAAWLCAVLMAVAAGNGLMGNAVAADLNELEQLSPFGARSLWLLR